MFSEKKSHNDIKTERRDPLGFFNIRSVAKHQKNEGGPFEEKKFREKSLKVPKNLYGGPLVSPGTVCYGGKTGKTFLVPFARRNGSI